MVKQKQDADSSHPLKTGGFLGEKLMKIETEIKCENDDTVIITKIDGGPAIIARISEKEVEEEVNDNNGNIEVMNIPDNITVGPGGITNKSLDFCKRMSHFSNSKFDVNGDIVFHRWTTANGTPEWNIWL